MSSVLSKTKEQAWHVLESLLHINSAADYRRARHAVDELVDEVGSNERHPRAKFMDTLATLVHDWEEKHSPVPPSSPRKVLGFLMDEHGLKQSDLKEIGSQGIVSEILAGKRELNVRQIRSLSRRFGISPAALID